MIPKVSLAKEQPPTLTVMFLKVNGKMDSGIVHKEPTLTPTYQSPVKMDNKHQLKCIQAPGKTTINVV